ncbi:MAG TPA: peptidoglycan DD-metalloendopeptidase family protein [Vicinamibacterales bacterium]|jgi:septal ring factor EnvC (AmiA/AmiB activator)|nr:peptidoglycan DD-metalloendopeptidase family protein [Vicinamibacterales bacterium]
MASRSISVAFAISAAVSLTLSAGLGQTNRDKATAASQRAADRIRALQREAEALATQESALLVQLRKLEVERQLKTEELAQIDRDRVETQRKLSDASTRAESLQRRAEAETPEIENRLVRVYKLGQPGYWRLMLDVDDLRSMGRAYRTASALNKIDRDRVYEHKQTLEALAKERQELETRAAQITSLETQAKRAKAALDRSVTDRSTLVAAIDARRDLNAQMTGELQAAQQKLQASLTQLDSAAAVVTLPLRPFQGALPWPLRGRIVGGFGRQSSSRFGTTIVRNGIEIGVNEGQLVRSVHDGTVAYAEPFSGYGNLVIVEHGERSYSLYGYLLSMQVSKGEHVEAQAPLGMSGRDPAGNPSLYFELRVDGKAVDPLQWLSRGSGP